MWLGGCVGGWGVKLVCVCGVWAVCVCRQSVSGSVSLPACLFACLCRFIVRSLARFTQRHFRRVVCRCRRRRRTLQVGARFSKTEELRKLTSDATNYFPVEFEMCDALSVRRTFVQQRKAMAGF